MAQNTRLNKEEIQEDKFIELVLQCYTFLKDNAITISVTLAIMIVGVVGYLVYTQNQERIYAEAAANFTNATETYKEAETNFLDVSAPSENEDDSEEEAKPEKATFQNAEEKLQIIFEKYPNTHLADKARYNFAKSLYYQGKYPEARAQFENVVETHQPENQIYALYAQKAVGNCYEQEGNYAEAISAYEALAFPTTPELAPEIRQFVLTSAKFHQALCHEKLNAIEGAQASYKEIIDEFQNTINAGIEQKSSDLIKEAKDLLTLIEEPLDLTKAESKETEELYFESLVAYTDVIRAYKVEKDVSGGLLSDVRKRIRRFEEAATTVINNVQSARKFEKSGNESGALESYKRVVAFDVYGLNSKLYEKAVLNYDRLAIAENGVSNEK
ncbi:MAG: tetratricopeptide repeat protein [Candidatus Poribacteria bacterium]|nr:tetratricopeptide repeat protein [Candidatus Poribacteria bacterium]